MSESGFYEKTGWIWSLSHSLCFSMAPVS